MSTVSTSVSSAATIILTDYYKPLAKHSGDRQHVRVYQLSSIVVGLLGCVVAIAMLSVESIIDAWWKLSSIFSGGMLGLFLLGYLSQRVRNVDAVIGVVCGVIIIGWISAATWLGLPESGLHEYLAIVLGTMTIFLVGFFLALLFNRKNKN